MFFNNTFILASSSSSRYKILKDVGLSFTKVHPRCKEDFLKKKLIKEKKNPSQISLLLARMKSKSISQIKINRIVVGSDTIISLNNKILNKAKNLKDAKKKIKLMSGKTHIVYSSVSVFYNNEEIWSTTQKTFVKIRELNNYEIDSYLLMAGDKILAAVGCYHIEKRGPNIIEGIKGDFFNVMGFPLFPFLAFLKKKVLNK
jgi:septum formation protein